MRRVLLPEPLRIRILDDARTAMPNECCGLLEGFRAEADFRIAALHPARNVAAARDRFAIEPADQFAAQRAARANGAVVIGCYHSHPGGQAAPSAIDQAGAQEENFLWLIAGGEKIAAFVYLRGIFTGADCVTSLG